MSALSGKGQTYPYNHTITVPHTLVASAPQTNFPIYVVYTDPTLKTVAKGGHVQSSTGADIAFFGDSALTKMLPFEIVSYNGTTGALSAVVQYPTLSATIDTVFYLGYGATSVTTSPANPAQVWANYLGVFHMEDSAGTNTVLNSATGASQTGNGVSISTTQSMSTPGVLGSGLKFRAGTDYIDLGAYTALNNAGSITYSAWVNFASLVDYATIVGKMDDPAGKGSVLSLSGQYASKDTDWFGSVRNSASAESYTVGYGITTGTWYYVAMVYSGGTVALYINGAGVNLSQGGTTATSVPTTTGDLLLGRESAYYNAIFGGEMDEVRVSLQNPSANWIQTEYNNQSNPAAFAVLGPETQTVAAAPTPQSFPVSVLGVTATQAILQYNAPDANACTVSVSDSSATNQFTGAFMNVVHDVDPTLFAGANLDTRAGNFVNGASRTIVVGLRGTGDALDGNAYSRALQASTTHFYQINCGNGSWIGTGSFTTANVLLGNGAPDPIAYDGNLWGGWAWPTINYSDLTQNYIDPQTGVLLKRWTDPNDEGSLEKSVRISNVADLAGTWQNPSNIGGASDGNVATYSGAGGPTNALFLWGRNSFYRPSYTPVTWITVDDIRFHVVGFGDQAAAADRSVTVCVSADYGQTCVGSPINIVLPQGASADASGPSAFPQPIFGGWGNAQVRPDMMTNNFGGSLASITGTTVNWGSNSGYGYNYYFPITALKAGSKVLISGSDPTCPNNLCTIASTVNETTLTIQQNLSNWTSTFTSLASSVTAGATTFTVTAANGFFPNTSGLYSITVANETLTCNTLTGNTFSNCNSFAAAHASGTAAGSSYYEFPNFGFKLWKTTSTGTISLDSSTSDWASSASFSTGDQGAGTPYCSSSTVTATYAADGITPIAPLPGYICIFSSFWGNQHLYFVAPSTGESRKLSNLANLSANLDPANPTHLYAYNNLNNTISTCAYNAADTGNGLYKAWSDGRNSSLDNPALICSNVSQPGQDVATEIHEAYPQIDLTYFGAPAFQGTSYPLFEFMMRPSQNAMAWFCTLDVSQPSGPAQVIRCRNDWDTYPIRWLGSHGNEYIDTYQYAMMSAQVPLNAPSTTAAERWDLNILQIYNNGGSTALTSTFLDPQTCEQLGVSNATWIAQGASGQNCIHINVDNEPLAKSPTPADLNSLGTLPLGSRPAAWTHNASSCGGDGTTTNCWSFLQAMAEGDYLQDASQAVEAEKFLIAKKTTLANGTIDLVLARNMNPFQCRGSVVSAQTHATNWTPSLWPPMTCSVGTYLSPIYSPSTQSIVDNPNIYTAHTVFWTTPTGNSVQLTPYSWSYPTDVGAYGAGYGVRAGPFPGVVGQGFTYGVNMVYPFAGNNSGITTNQIQTHPGGITSSAPPRESGWGVDGRPLGGVGGGVQYLWNQNLTKVAGTQNTYQITLPLTSPTGPIISFSGWDVSLKRKLRQVLAFAGYHLLQDISGPGSTISDATPWSYCVADLAGECVSGSLQGNQYMSVPDASPSGVCSNDGTVYDPCLAGAGPHAAAYLQFEVDRADPFGLRWRKLTNMLDGPGRTDNYANIHALVTGDWGVSATRWGNGLRGDVFGVKLPPWPNEDSIARNNFVKIPLSLGGQAGTSVRVRFGYNANLYCSTRREQCSTAVTNSDPYAWLSEPQTWTPCSNPVAGCQINIPAISGRMLYYVVDRETSSGTIVSGPVTITPVN
ncbi:MAG: LamG domain-containing protein [Bryobacteraceae bacterium]